MKPFLGIDLTRNRKNEQLNGSEFVVQKPSVVLSDSLEKLSDQAEKTVKRSELPLALRIVQFVCGLAALVIVCGIGKADVSFQEGYRNAPWLFWAAGVCGATWLVLWLLGKRKAKAVLETDESTQTFSHLDGIADTIYMELGVPADAECVDVLSFFYKTKDGAIRVQEKSFQLAQYFNPEFKIFSDSENLYLANLEGKYAFPLFTLSSIRTVKKNIRIMGWNKETDLRKEKYKQYRLRADNYGCVHCKYYHILEGTHRGAIFGIYIPCYDLPAFEKYSGLLARSE